MNSIWTQHRFSGGSLALNVTNTVVLRGDPERSFDRFDDAAEIGRFAEAAERFCKEELAGRKLVVADPDASRDRILTLREATDALFRVQAAGRGVDGALLPPFLNACASALGGQSGPVWRSQVASSGDTRPVAFEAAVAASALSLLDSSVRPRIRICANCRWLFIDRSRNGSRRWCDMTVCGNRQKARRHYQRRIQNEGGIRP